MSDQYTPPQANVDDVNRSNAQGITNAMIDSMRGTKQWVLLIGIVLILGAVFMVLGTIGIFIAGAVGVGATGSGGGAALMGMAVVYGFMSLIYIMLAVYLIKYSSSIGRLLTTQSVGDMEDALDSQRKFWKLSGVITAVMLVLMVLGFIAAMIIPLMQMSV